MRGDRTREIACFLEFAGRERPAINVGRLIIASSMKRLRILRRWFATEIRLCAAGLSRAADRISGAAHCAILRRSKSFASASSTLLPALRSPGEDGKARHHRRYRRKEPCRFSASMAVAADAHCRHRQQSDAARRRCDRVRRRVLRARPSQSRDAAADMFRNLDEGDPGQAERAAEQRPDPRRQPSGIRVSCSAHPALPKWSTPISTRTCSGNRVGHAGRGPAAFMFNFAGLLRNTRVLEVAAAGRGSVHHPARTRRHHHGACQ